MYTNEEINSIVGTIHEQLTATTTLAVRWSWGISKQKATIYEGMPTLALKVSGALHKGRVYISYDSAADLYNIYTLSDKGEVRHKVEGVYFPDMGAVIDGIIERDPSATDEEYLEVAMADSNRKLSA